MSQNTRSKTAALRANSNPRSVTPSPRAPSNADTRPARVANPKPASKAELQQVHLEAREHLALKGILKHAEACTPTSIVKALHNFMKVHKLDSEAAQSIQCIGTVVETMAFHCAGCTRTDFLTDMLDIHLSTIQSNLEDKFDEVKQALQEKLPSQVASADSPPGAIEETTKSLNQAAARLEGMITRAADSTTELANTARTYKEALLSNPVNAPARGTTAGQNRQTSVEAVEALNTVRERKDRQVLIETSDAQILSYSIDTLQEKVQHAIRQIVAPPPPSDTSISHISRTRKPGIIINFNTREAASWLRHSDVSHMFEAYFISGASVIPRHYAILVPRVPITFDPTEQTHLREIEEANGLAKNVIAKAKWIKPIYRRKPEQRVAHASLILTDPSTANNCIRDGISIFGARLYPTKLRQEPTQCMKCRGWGHFAVDCTNDVSTCGTCGGEHRTSDCDEAGKRYCVSCRSDAHASWDRNCPEFLKRCSWYDERHPDNSLRYFPTDESWTQEVRPARYPLTERFPANFATVRLSPPLHNGRDIPPGQHGRPPKRPNLKNKGKRPAGQTTITGYFRSSQSQEQLGDDSNAREEGEVSTELFQSFEQSDYAGTASAIDMTGWE
jgi:hypothetical protein